MVGINVGSTWGPRYLRMERRAWWFLPSSTCRERTRKNSCTSGLHQVISSLASLHNLLPSSLLQRCTRSRIYCICWQHRWRSPKFPCISKILTCIHSVTDTISFLYPPDVLQNPAKCLKRALLSPKNIFVNDFNEHIKAEHECTCGWPGSVPTGISISKCYTGSMLVSATRCLRAMSQILAGSWVLVGPQVLLQVLSILNRNKENSFFPKQGIYKHYLYKYFWTFNIFIDCAVINFKKHQLHNCGNTTDPCSTNQNV